MTKTINEWAAALGNSAMAEQAILAEVDAFLQGRWRASIEAQAPRMAEDDRIQEAQLAILLEIRKFAKDARRLAETRDVAAWLCAVAKRAVLRAGGRSSETGVGGTTELFVVQQTAYVVRRRRLAAGESSTDQEVIAEVNASRRRTKDRKISTADLRRVETVAFDTALEGAHPSAVGIQPRAVELDVAAAVALLPEDQRQVAELCLMSDYSLAEAALQLGYAKSKVYRLLAVAKTALAVTLSNYAPYWEAA